MLAARRFGRRPAGIRPGVSSGLPECRQRLEVALQYRGSLVISEPAFDCGGIHAAKVHRSAEVVAFRQVREARGISVMSALYGLARRETSGWRPHGRYRGLNSREPAGRTPRIPSPPRGRRARAVPFGRALDVDAGIEKRQHGRVPRHGQQQRVEVAQPLCLEQFNLLEHLPVVAHLVLIGGEMTVPEERDLFLERAFCRQHAVRPPVGDPVAFQAARTEPSRRTC